MFKKLEKATKYLTLPFLAMFALTLVGNVIKINLGPWFMRIFMVITFLYLGIVSILSVNYIYRGLKRDRERTISRLLSKFVSLFLIVTVLSYLKTQSLNLGFGLVFSLLASIFTFYNASRLEGEEETGD